MKAKSQLPYILVRRLVVRLQSDSDVSIGGSTHAAVVVSEIYARNRKTDVIDDALKLIGRDLFSDCFFDFVHEFSRFFNASARSRAHVEPKDAGVHGREEVLAEKREGAAMSRQQS